jgi:hypothetical protein
MGYTFGGSAPAYILAVYPCSDSPTVYSVPVGVALSLPHFKPTFLALTHGRVHRRLFMLPICELSSHAFFLVQ